MGALQNNQFLESWLVNFVALCNFSIWFTLLEVVLQLWGFFLVPTYIDLCPFSDKIPQQASPWQVILYFSRWYWSVWLEDKLTLGHGVVMLITGGKCFELCNIRWKIYQFFSALFLKSSAWEITLPFCDDSVNYFIYMEIAHVQWLWKPSDMLRESCQKAICVQCKNCNILQKWKEL